MKLIKPNWVVHEDAKEKGRKMPIYTIHVHPDGSRLATGGLDSKIRIWSTLPILDSAVEANEANPKLLCTMAQHDGSVMCVRWAHHGRYLASGSDDTVVVIWDLDPRGGGRVFGSSDVNVETWKPLHRLVGHSSDVVDIAWSRDDSMIATVGLDSAVFVWDSSTFNVITKITQHQGFVKGVCWDPVGQFLATQSDDKSVKIWRTSDWSLETSITEPFKASPASTFFRRLSWSPDGAFIASSNAMNLAVFTAAILQRRSETTGEWKQSVSFIGHENTVQVTAFNPRVFHTSDKITRSRVNSMVALGSDDRSISVWLNQVSTPILVVKEVFDGQIWDLSWTAQGRTLYGCSSDGTIACLHFEEDELKGFAADGVLEQILETYDYVGRKPIVRRPVTHLPAATPAITINHLIAKPSTKDALTSNPIASTAPVPLPSPTPQVITVSKKNGKKRIQPAFLGGSGEMAASTNSAPSSLAFGSGPVAGPSTIGRSPQAAFGSSPTISHPRLGQAAGVAPSPLRGPFDVEMDDHTGSSPNREYSQPPPAWPALNNNGTPSANSLGKRKGLDDLISGPLPGSSSSRTKFRTLGGSVAREDVQEVELRAAAAGGGSSTFSLAAGLLPVPPIKSILKASVDDSPSADWIEARNSLSFVVEVSRHSPSQVQWVDYLPSQVVSLAVTSYFAAFGCEDGSLHTYTVHGRKLFSTIQLDSAVSSMNTNGKTGLSIITARGSLCGWNVKTRTSLLPSTSPNLSTILTNGISLIQSSLRPNNVPVFFLSTGETYAYSSQLSAFLRVSSSFHALGSSHWEASRTRSSAAATQAPTTSSRGVIGALEAAVTDLPTLSQAKPEAFDLALTLAHLESRMLACVELGVSEKEYKNNLALYVRRLGEEGFRGKAEELVKELAGEVTTQFPNLASLPRHADVPGSNLILGVPRREILKEVVGILVRSKLLPQLGKDWSDVLRKVVLMEKDREDH